MENHVIEELRKDYREVVIELLFMTSKHTLTTIHYCS